MLSVRFQAKTVFGSSNPMRRAISVGPVRSKMLAKVVMQLLYETYSDVASAFCSQSTAGSLSWSRMSERHERLRRARERKGFVGPKEAATAYGWNSNSYSSNENGNAPFSFKAADKYARAFGVRAEWLYNGSGPMVEAPRRDATQEVPIVSWVSAGQLLEAGEIIPEDDEWVHTSGLRGSRYFATRVKGDSMDRYSPENSVIIVDAEDRDPRPGKAYVFSVDGQTTYKIYEDEPVIRLEPHSTNPFNKPIFPKDLRRLVVIGRVVRSMLDIG